MLFLSSTISKILYIFLNDILPIKGDFNTKYQKAYGKNLLILKMKTKKRLKLGLEWTKIQSFSLRNTVHILMQ